MYQLTNKPLRFSELKRQIPDVSEKMLIQELKNLADSRLITRHDFGEIPPKVAYALTATGQKIMPIIAEMRNFAVIYEKEISSSETVFETD